MSWLKDLIGTEKVIIGMCHMQALPGDPDYDKEKGIDFVISTAKKDLIALQEGGIDAVLFSNEFSLPYLLDVEVCTVAAMARIIGELKSYIKIPFGVNVLWDPIKTIDLAAATGAYFVREVFSGIYASDFGLWNTNPGKSARHRCKVGANEVKLIYNIVPEASRYIAQRDLESIAKTTLFNCKPDAFCVSGNTAGTEANLDILKKVKSVLKDSIVLVNTGVNINNFESSLKIADGAIVGTYFKYDGIFENNVDKDRVTRFMEAVREFRK